ncbi:helix-turn-helix domain-containing protein [Halobacteria archaeon AArc-m2/3/4]|uniref:Helix-turn-helix domain-containing protein n=1 Tax=Natronoglomus mannanivorans TaxID=2979990 RepID=A0ABT2QII5_9EURY|nr:helix-turn-helix domain-containing protein [Halobacteria archaeon AArc-m2/3/4]
MARLFPLRSETPAKEGQPRVVDLEDEDADAVFSALSSTTARRIYSRLNEEPGTPSDIAEAIDSSIQNVRYHLEKLEDAGLVEVVDTWYSSRGNEMSVYATADGPLIVTSDKSRADQLRDALSRYLGGVAVLGGASLFVQYGLGRFLSSAQSAAQWRPSVGLGADDEGDAAPGASGNGNGDGDGDGGAYTTGRDDVETRDGDDAAVDEADETDEAAEAFDADTDDAEGTESEYLEAEDAAERGPESADSSTPAETEIETVTTAADHAADASDTIVATLPPGLLFFLGGLLVLTVVTVWWYRTTY